MLKDDYWTYKYKGCLQSVKRETKEQLLAYINKNIQESETSHSDLYRQAADGLYDPPCSLREIVSRYKIIHVVEEVYSLDAQRSITLRLE